MVAWLSEPFQAQGTKRLRMYAPNGGPIPVQVFVPVLEGLYITKGAVLGSGFAPRNGWMLRPQGIVTLTWFESVLSVPDEETEVVT
jgi:hypothetical protein